MPSLIAGAGSILAGGIGDQQATEGTIEGARTQAGIEGLGRDASRREFGRQISRQRPFVDAGTMALPEFVQSISNRGDVSGLPATQIQSDLISNFLGDQSPEFVLNRALGNLEAIEAEKNKGRLSDLINIGLGGVGATAGAGVNLGNTLGQSLATTGNRTGQSLQDAATLRQNQANLLTTGLSGLPSLAAAIKGPGQPSINQQLSLAPSFIG